MNTINEREEKLLRKKAEVEEQIKMLEKHSTDFGDDIDPDEETQESEEIANKLGLMQELKVQLQDILKTLDDLRGEGSKERK